MVGFYMETLSGFNGVWSGAGLGCGSLKTKKMAIVSSFNMKQQDTFNHSSDAHCSQGEDQIAGRRCIWTGCFPWFLMVFSFCLSPNEQRTASDCDCVSTGKHARTLPRPLVASGLCHCIKSARTQSHTHTHMQRPQRTVCQDSQYCIELRKGGKYRQCLHIYSLFELGMCWSLCLYPPHGFISE